MKKFTAGILIFDVLILAIGIVVGSNTLGSTKAECPSGTYAIDEGICKAEPTGCPYGDSIPMEKCQIQMSEEKTVETVAPSEPVIERKKVGNACVQ